MRRALVALALLVSTMTGSVVGAPSASANAVVPLDLTGFVDLVVDEAHGHLFISEGRSRVVVTDLAGSVVTTLKDLPGARDMAMSDDGSVIYVALHAGDAIAAIQTSDLSVVKYPTGDALCPNTVGVTEGLVWFAYSCDWQWHSVAALDPSTGAVTLTEAGSYYNPSFETSPARPGVIVVGENGLSPPSIYVLTVEGGEQPTAVETARRWDVAVTDRTAISPDGSQVVTVGGQVFDLPGLGADGSLARGIRTAVAIRDDGMVAFGRYDGLSVQPYERRSPLRTYVFPAPRNTPAAALGVAWGSTDVYVVTHQGRPRSSGYKLRVITPRPGSTISIDTDRSRYDYGDRAAVTVRLTGAPGSSQISLYTTTSDGTRRLVRTARTDADGVLHVAIPVYEATRITASFAGNDSVDGSSTSASVEVAARVTASMVRARGHDGPYALYGVASTLWLVAKVSPDHEGGSVRFHAQFKTPGGTWRYDGFTRWLTLSATSKAATYLHGDPDLLGVGIRIRAEWGGDKVNLEQKSDWEYARFVR